MVSRPFVFVLVLLLIVFTSQLEWSQQIVNEIEANPNISRRQQYLSKREESVKEKVILSQENNIQKLTKLVRTLQEQLLQCRGIIEAVNHTGNTVTEPSK